MRLRRRTVVRCVVVAVVSIAAMPFVLFGLYLATTGGTGSAGEAARLRKVVESIPNPEAGQGAYREYFAKRFKDGEWALGIGRDSHGLLSKYLGGGTLVVKDSRGQVRCFFGHVCGGGGHSSYMDQANSLDDFYKRIMESGTFAEYKGP